jgi:hypothetical protein
MAKGKEVAVRKSTEVADWQSMMKASAAKQVKAAESLTTGSIMVSFKGGVLTIAGMQRRNNAAEVIVLAVMNERAKYEGPYNPDEPRTPVCYAYGEVDGGMPVSPHEASSDSQNATCRGCPHAEWGTADVGRGQACRQSVKLALLALPEAGKPTVQDLENAEINFARIPPTSLKAVKVYLDWLGAQDSATFAHVTKLECRPSSKSIFTVHLTPEREILPAWRSAVASRVREGQAGIAAPYPTFENEKPKPAATGKKRF